MQVQMDAKAKRICLFPLRERYINMQMITERHKYALDQVDKLVIKYSIQLKMY